MDAPAKRNRTVQVRAWLKDRNMQSIFVTGQEQVAAEYPELSLAVISKPVLERELCEKLKLFRRDQ